MSPCPNANVRLMIFRFTVVPQHKSFMLITLLYIVTGLIITTMCIDLVGSQYIRKIHFFGRNINKARFMLASMGGRIVNLGDAVRLVNQMQKRYGLNFDQMDVVSSIPEQFLWDVLLHGKPLPPYWKGVWLRPFVPHDIHLIRFIDQKATLSQCTTERMRASLDSFDVASSTKSTARTIRDYSWMLWERDTTPHSLPSR